jgi:hypothetical protein
MAAAVAVAVAVVVTMVVAMVGVRGALQTRRKGLCVVAAVAAVAVERGTAKAIPRSPWCLSLNVWTLLGTVLGTPKKEGRRTEGCINLY